MLVDWRVIAQKLTILEVLTATSEAQDVGAGTTTDGLIEESNAHWCIGSIKYYRAWVQGYIVAVEDDYILLDDGSGVLCIDLSPSSKRNWLNKEALGKYVMCMGQIESGPSKRPNSYMIRRNEPEKTIAAQGMHSGNVKKRRLNIKTDGARMLTATDDSDSDVGTKVKAVDVNASSVVTVDDRSMMLHNAIDLTSQGPHSEVMWWLELADMAQFRVATEVRD
eukprot:GFYU01011073.1.p1 GENE.GFYU01011073.1~~GFYU01011073.1.p1  ORF type:complete len:222 (+),score=32.99 GFYU01011073.1:142-807(+)